MIFDKREEEVREIGVHYAMHKKTNLLRRCKTHTTTLTSSSPFYLQVTNNFLTIPILSHYSIIIFPNYNNIIPPFTNIAQFIILISHYPDYHYCNIVLIYHHLIMYPSFPCPYCPHGYEIVGRGECNVGG